MCLPSWRIDTYTSSGLTIGNRAPDEFTSSDEDPGGYESMVRSFVASVTHLPGLSTRPTSAGLRVEERPVRRVHGIGDALDRGVGRDEGSVDRERAILVGHVEDAAHVRGEDRVWASSGAVEHGSVRPRRS